MPGTRTVSRFGVGREIFSAVDSDASGHGVLPPPPQSLVDSLDRNPASFAPSLPPCLPLCHGGLSRTAKPHPMQSTPRVGSTESDPLRRRLFLTKVRSPSSRSGQPLTVRFPRCPLLPSSRSAHPQSLSVSHGASAPVPVEPGRLARSKERGGRQGHSGGFRSPKRSKGLKDDLKW